MNRRLSHQHALTFTNVSILRSVGAGGSRTWQVRVDAQNLFNREQWLGRR